LAAYLGEGGNRILPITIIVEQPFITKMINIDFLWRLKSIIYQLVTCCRRFFAVYLLLPLGDYGKLEA